MPTPHTPPLGDALERAVTLHRRNAAARARSSAYSHAADRIDKAADELDPQGPGALARDLLTALARELRDDATVALQEAVG